MEKKGNEEELKRYFLFGIIILLLFLSFKIIQPYLVIIISAFILAYLVFPLFIRLNKKLNKGFSAIICIFVILFVVLLPLGGIVGGVLNQTSNLLSNESIVNFLSNINDFPLLDSFNISFSKIFENGGQLIISLLSSALSYIPTLIISLIILVLGIYYILVNYKVILSELKVYLPFKDKDKIAKEIDKSTKGIIYGSLLIAIIEFVIAAGGFYFSGVNPYLLLPLIIFFFAFIPGLGSTIVWVPLAMYYFIVGNWFAFGGVVITGIIISLLIDIILKNKILGERSNINPFIMLLGVFGGISFFGIFGFIIGPLILIYSLKILREYFKK